MTYAFAATGRRCSRRRSRILSFDFFLLGGVGFPSDAGLCYGFCYLFLGHFRRLFSDFFCDFLNQFCGLLEERFCCYFSRCFCRLCGVGWLERREGEDLSAPGRAGGSDDRLRFVFCLLIGAVGKDFCVLGSGVEELAEVFRSTAGNDVDRRAELDRYALAVLLVYWCLLPVERQEGQRLESSMFQLSRTEVRIDGVGADGLLDASQDLVLLGHVVLEALVVSLELHLTLSLEMALRADLLECLITGLRDALRSELLSAD